MSSAYVLLGAHEPELKELFATLFEADSDEAVFIFPGNPVEELEKLPETLSDQELTLARIIALVDAPTLEKRDELKAWFEALAHFADVLLLTNTKNVSPAWMNAFKKSLKDRPLEILNYPEVLQKNHESAIAQIVYPEARRLSQHFELTANADTQIYEGENDNDELLDDDPLPADPYFVRDAAGRFMIKIISP